MDLAGDIKRHPDVQRVSADLLGGGVQKGGKIWFRCPFHQERTGSFFVDENGSFHCFGCGEHGSCFDLVIRLHGASFVQSLEFFASRLGISIDGWQPKGAGKKSPRSDIGTLNDDVKREVDLLSVRLVNMREDDSELGTVRTELVRLLCDMMPRRQYLLALDVIQSVPSLYEKKMIEFRPWVNPVDLGKRRAKPDKKEEDLTRSLQAAQRVFSRAPRRDWLIEILGARGIHTSVIDQFDIGYCPNDRDDFLDRYLAEGGNLSIGTKVGIFDDSASRGEFNPRFHGRMTLPIRNIHGEIVSFAGRVIDDRQPKYMNGPETAVFKKRSNLYGASQALRAIQRENFVLVFEGYTDVWMLAQNGVENVIASMGTSVSREQAKILSWMPKVIFVFDGDDAGVMAAHRALPVCLQEGCFPWVAWLPDGLDPADLVKERGLGSFQKVISSAEPLLVPWVKQVKDTDEKRRNDILSKLLRGVKDPWLRMHLQEHFSSEGIEMPLRENEVGGFHLVHD